MKGSNSSPVHKDYIEFQICDRLKCLPDDLDRLPPAKVMEFYYFMKAESEAAILKEKQASFHSKARNGR